MILKNAILKEHSKEQTHKIALWIAGEESRMQELMVLFFSKEEKVAQRAAWVMSAVAEQQPNLVLPYLSKMINKLNEPVHDSLKRHVLRALQFVDIEEQLHSAILNHCFHYLTNPKEALAVRAFALSTVARLAEHYPELNNELKIIIEDAMQHEPAASFKSRANKILKKL